MVKDVLEATVEAIASGSSTQPAPSACIPVELAQTGEGSPHCSWTIDPAQAPGVTFGQQRSNASVQATEPVSVDVTCTIAEISDNLPVTFH